MALRQSVGEFTEALLASVCSRLELFSLEATDQTARLLRLMALLGAALFFAALAVVLLSATIALYFWPTPYRYLALWLMVLLYVILGVAAFWMLRRNLRNGAFPFSATLDELRRDISLAARLRDERSPASGDKTDSRGVS